MCPAATSWRAVSSPSPLVAPVMSVVVVDCDVLTVSGSDLRVVAFTAAPGSEDADKLRLLAVLGTEDFSPRV